jgi:hypothetical protein
VCLTSNQKKSFFCVCWVLADGSCNKLLRC